MWEKRVLKIKIFNFGYNIKKCLIFLKKVLNSDTLFVTVGFTNPLTPNDL
jgi:hypothetical protein